MNYLTPRKNKTRIVSRRELLISLYNEQHDQLVRFKVDRRLAERMLLTNVTGANKQEMERMAVLSKHKAKMKQEALNIIMDQILEMDKAEEPDKPKMGIYKLKEDDKKT